MVLLGVLSTHTHIYIESTYSCFTVSTATWLDCSSFITVCIPYVYRWSILRWDHILNQRLLALLERRMRLWYVVINWKWISSISWMCVLRKWQVATGDIPCTGWTNNCFSWTLGPSWDFPRYVRPAEPRPRSGCCLGPRAIHSRGHQLEPLRSDGRVEDRTEMIPIGGFNHLRWCPVPSLSLFSKSLDREVVKQQRFQPWGAPPC